MFQSLFPFLIGPDYSCFNPCPFLIGPDYSCFNPFFHFSLGRTIHVSIPVHFSLGRTIHVSIPLSISHWAGLSMFQSLFPFLIGSDYSCFNLSFHFSLGRTIHVSIPLSIYSLGRTIHVSIPLSISHWAGLFMFQSLFPFLIGPDYSCFNSPFYFSLGRTIHVSIPLSISHWGGLFMLQSLVTHPACVSVQRDDWTPRQTCPPEPGTCPRERREHRRSCRQSTAPSGGSEETE